MYISFILIPLDYFRTLGKRWSVVTFEWGLPALIGFWFFHSLYKHSTSCDFNDYINKIISLEGVLVGFSITSITFLTTASNKSIEQLGQHKTRYRIGKKTLSLMDLILINFSYSLLSEVLLLIVNLAAPVILLSYELNFGSKIILIAINIGFVLHNLFLNIRNLSDIYFAIMKKD